MNNLSFIFWFFTLVLTLAESENKSETTVPENASNPPTLSRGSEQESLSDAQAATTTFGSFLEKHVFQPNTNILLLKEKHHQDFGIDDWNDLLEDRLWDYGDRTRNVNSVVIGSRSDIVNTFRTQIAYTIDGKIQPGLYWSEEKFPMYLFRWSNSSQLYDAFNCPEMYFVAATDNTTSSLKPIHFEGQQETRIDKKLTIPWDSCKQLQNDSTKLNPHIVVFMVVSLFFTINNFNI